MFHATNARLGRKARRIRDIRVTRDNQAASAHGWQAREIKPGTWRYRDPRFDHRQHAGIATSTPKRPAASRAISNGGSRNAR
jgi:hypothetical protein